MSKKASFKFLGIALFVALILGPVVFSACRSDRSSAEQVNPRGIPAYDNTPTWSPNGQKIAYASERDGNVEIYTMDADGSNQIRLTDNPGDDLFPYWSPDGTRIAFTSKRDGNEEIYIMNADGSNQIRLTDSPSKDWFSSWSPDGKKIAFDSDRDGNNEIYIMNSDGSGLTRLTDNPAKDAYASWSPDGSRFTFNSNRDGDYDIYTMNGDGSNLIRLTDNSTSDGIPSWSPDGTSIAFHSNRDGNMEIYIMNADGSNQVRLTDNPGFDGCPSWSPDGQKIAFETDRDFDEEIYVMNADGSNPVNLTNNAPVNATSGLAPLPRSELDLDNIPYRIVFESFRETNGKENWEICLINADGTDFVNLTNSPEIDEMYPHASPDGSLICFVADEGEGRENRSRYVYYMNIDGTDRVKVAENAFHPCWSPDGRYIAYLPGEYPRYNRDFRATKGLEIYDIETKEVKKHPNEKILHHYNLCWSPDGEWLIAAGPNSAFRVDDNTKMRLKAPGCRPDFSPDGKRIAWNGTDWSINIGRIDFSSPQSNVSDHTIVVACDRDHEVYHVDWSPDGNYLTFCYFPYSGNEGVSYPAPGANICICDLRTGKWTQITTDGKHNKEPDWIPVQVR